MSRLTPAEVERLRRLGGLDPYQLLTPREVALLFGVTRRTVSAWATHGRLSYVRTPGGQFRFRAAEVRALRTFRRDNQPQPRGDR